MLSSMSIKNPSTLFFLIATTLVLGIFLGATFGLSLLFFVLAFSSSLLCAFVLFLLGSKHIFLTVILAFISCIVGNLRYQMVLGQYDTSIPKKTITGQIISNPQDKSYGQSFVFITSKNQKVLVQNRGQELFEYDDKATLQVICSRPKNFETDLGGTFDYVRYLKKDHIYAQCQFEKGTVHTRQPSFMKTLYLFSNRLSNRIDALFKTPHDNFIAGVLVGDKTDIAPEMRNDFIKTGTIHILALSGYNIAIVALFFQKFFYLFFRKKGALLFSAIAVILFVAMTGFSASAIRAGIMALIVIIAQLSYQPYSALRALFFASLLMILYDPFYFLYDSSFHLSFLATYGVVVFTPYFEILFKRLPTRFLRLTIATTCGAYIITLPYLLFFFTGISVFSIVVNSLVGPLIPFVMLGSAITLTLSLISLSFAYTATLLTEWVSSLILSLIHLFATIPFGYIPVSVSWAVCMLLYGLVFYLLYYFKKKYDSKDSS